MATVELQLIEGLGLPYASGAEAALLDSSLDPVFDAAWQAFVAAFPGLTLAPLFDELPVEQLADLVDGVRVNGDEPPNPFLWFTLECDESVVAAVVAGAQALPMVVFAQQRIEGIRAANVSYGTNPDTRITMQIQSSPTGVDAIYAWQVAGGDGAGSRVTDLEDDFWLLDHDELLTANVHKLSVFGTEDFNHATPVAGIVVGADNGVGTIGIVPAARLELLTSLRGSGIRNSAAAINLASARLGAGDVLLIELALSFLPNPGPDVLMEFDPSIQDAIRLATARGITVVEPAGNGGINLDRPPVLAHTRPGSPTFSGAVVVGAADLTDTGTWKRTESSFGSRVDCFAAGSLIRAPSSAATDAYRFFSGTSGASAIIAGVVASLQSMALAATGTALPPAEVRMLMRSASLGTLPEDPLAARIGAMPDLREIIRAKGFVRILPVGAALIGGDALFIVHLDADNLLVRRHFTLLTGWGPPVPSPTPDGTPSPTDLFELTPAQPAVTSTDEVDPVSRLVFDAFLSGPGGCHHMFWDSLNQAGDVRVPIAPLDAAAQGRALGAVRPLLNLVVIAAISPAGRLVVMTGDLDPLIPGMSAPLVLDAFGMYRGIAGPTIVSRGPGLADIVVIEDGGSLSWFTGRFPATIGTGWSGPVIEPSFLAFDPGARPALLATGGVLLAAAVGGDGRLRAVSIDPEANAVEVPVDVDPAMPIATSGPVALGLTALNIVAVAVDTQGTLRAATRPIAGGDWTLLIPILAPIPISPLGGVSVVTIDIGVMAIAVGIDGIVCSALSVDGLIWTPLVPLPTA